MNNFCSNCGGGWGCCACGQPSCNYTINLPSTGGGGTITAGANINLNGVGVFDSIGGTTLQFRGINSANGFLAVSLDNPNHVILLSLDVNALAAVLPQATTTQAGVGETATDAEAIAKASTAVFVTPSNFAAMASSPTFAGFTAYATNAQAITGSSTTLALTPGNLTAVLATKGTTVVFADAPARAAAVPAFKGQYGVEQDDNTAWISNGTLAGNWTPLFVLGNTNVQPSGTAVDLRSSSSFTFLSSTSDGSLFLDGSIDFNVNANTFFAGNAVDFTSSQYSVNGGAGLLNVVVITDNAGQFDAMQITDFASVFAISSGWSGFSNSLVRKTCDCNTVTLPQLAQIVDTLINILKIPQLPAT